MAERSIAPDCKSGARTGYVGSNPAPSTHKFVLCASSNIAKHYAQRILPPAPLQMKLSKLNYHLPKKYIAQSPVTPRDHSKLLTINKKDKKTSHLHFYQIINLLNKNDILVFNDTKVFPARLIGKKHTGGKAEILLLKDLGGSVWEAITKPGFEVGDKIYFEKFSAKITKRENYITELKFSLSPDKIEEMIFNIGRTPTPPYIKPILPEDMLRKKYQTVYAQNIGSAAAPTAGFHFTKALLGKLNAKGVQMEYVTLHVGLGTFAPVKEENIEKHQIHSEHFEVNNKTIERLNHAKAKGKRIIAVGTTTTRVLETLAKDGALTANYTHHNTKLFIYPPFKFKFVDSLITNFHLPKSTLLALVCAFVSYPNTKEKFKSFQKSLLGKAYKEAIENNYRFFSFGDACFIY